MDDEQKKWLYYAIPVAVVVALGGVLYYGKRHKEEMAAPPEPAVEAPVAPRAASPQHHPIETPTAAEPLPPLAESDEPVHQSLARLFGSALDRYLVPRDIIKHFVATIDNLPRKKTAAQLWPVKPAAGQLMINEGDELTLSEANTERYAPLVQLATAVDTKQLVAVYRRFYPLFQQAYVDLGYPEGYFNDRLIEVIDHLLETPEIDGPVRLTQPGVFYEFADPSLESRSAGQKVLLRMGNKHAAAVKLKLRDLRREIAQRP
jgi:hypothetical protein